MAQVQGNIQAPNVEPVQRLVADILRSRMSHPTSISCFSNDPDRQFVCVTHAGPEADDVNFMQEVRDLIDGFFPTLHTDPSSTFLKEDERWRKNRINVVPKARGVW
jgi:hypothetical protein